MKPGSILGVAVRRGVSPWAPFLLNQPMRWSGAATEGRPYKSKLSILICVLSVFSRANAQEGLPQYSSLTGHCEGTIYTGSQIPQDHKARIKNRTLPSMTQQALSDDIHGTVIIEAVLCRNGQVTDLEVLQDLPNGLTQEAIRSVLGIEFTPAEINLHSVSQKMRFEFSFNERKSGVINPREAEGKLIRRIEVVGNRRLQSSDIMGLIKTEVGDKYNETQVKQDFASLLSTGYFEPGGTSVTTEAGPDDEITVILEVQERPLITDVRFEGFGGAASEILRALQSQNIDLRPGSIYDVGKVKMAASVIKKMLEQSGQNASVEFSTEEISFDRVSLIFLIVHQ